MKKALRCGGLRPALGTTAFVLAALAALLGMTPAAEAEKPRGTVVMYGFSAAGPAATISFGQLFSAKRACVADRRYKAIVSFQGNRTVVDSGRTSDDGGMSVFLTVSDFPHDRGDGFVSLARTRKCAKVTGPAAPEITPTAAPLRATSSEVDFIDIFGGGDDRVVGGFIDSEDSKCLRDRKVKLMIGSKVLDTGTTTSTEGTFALHVTGDEITGGQMAILAPDAKKCAASLTTFSPPSG